MDDVYLDGGRFFAGLIGGPGEKCGKVAGQFDLGAVLEENTGEGTEKSLQLALIGCGEPGD